MRLRRVARGRPGRGGAGGPGGRGGRCRAAAAPAGVPPQGALEVSAGDRGLVAKLVEIAGGLGPGEAEGEDGLYLGISVPRADDSGPVAHTGLGLLLDHALRRAPAHRSGRKRPSEG